MAASSLRKRAGRLLRRIVRGPLGRKASAFVERHRHTMPVVFFFGGVAWDALTLRRIDAVFDNLVLFVYLTLAGALIVTGALVAAGRLRRPWTERYGAWISPAIQFLLGALFSAYVVFYARSASWTESSLYLVVLVALLVGNEFVHRRAANVYLLLALYFLAAFSFFVFFLPVVTKRLDYAMFLAAGGVSLALLGAMITLLRARRALVGRQTVYALGLVVGLFGLMNLFYHRNWIPPVPLALRDGGVFHQVRREGTAFVLRYEPVPGRYGIDSDRRFRYAEGDTVYCFTAVFAPTELTAKVFHAWAYFDEARDTWVETDRIGYALVGGRDHGYRGVTWKRYVHPGAWRVEVVTGTGQVLGRIRFRIEAAPASPRRWRERRYE
ncbi:DUF2914 domain-containing protein [Rhodocaloribacter sp.]